MAFHRNNIKILLLLSTAVDGAVDTGEDGLDGLVSWLIETD